MNKIKTGILGCTGIVGQVFVWMLANHKWFDVSFISASSSREGKSYLDEVKWMIPYEIPEYIKNKKIESLDYSELKKRGIKIIFSALPAEIARIVEPELRENNFWVFSNASALRYEDAVPILIPEINLDSIDLIKKQGYPHNGFVITNANCSTTGIAVALAPLKKFDIEEVYISTYQSVSGAGFPGLSALDISNNAIPYIKGEENKMIVELKKILQVKAEIYPFCVRIPTLFGHLETVWLRFKKEVHEGEIIEAWKNFRLKNINIPSLPEQPIIYCEDEFFPQPKMSFFGNPPGMPVYTGRLKRLNDKVGFVLLANNLVKGAAGGSIENAEAFIQLYGDKQ